jgi:hypothetical protein
MRVMAENDIYIRTHKDDLNVIEQINCQKELYRDKTNETDTWSQLNIFLQCFEEEKSVNDSYVPYDGAPKPSLATMIAYAKKQGTHYVASVLEEIQKQLDLIAEGSYQKFGQDPLLWPALHQFRKTVLHAKHDEAMAARDDVLIGSLADVANQIDYILSFELEHWDVAKLDAQIADAKGVKLEVVPAAPEKGLAYWKVVLRSNIKKIDEPKKADARAAIKYLRGLNDKRLPNKGDVDSLIWIDDNENEQPVTKKTIQNALSEARKKP